MNKRRDAGTRRFALSAMLALPVTVALLFVMTRLILPTERDRVVARIIQNIELERAEHRLGGVTQPAPDPPPPLRTLVQPSVQVPTNRVVAEEKTPDTVVDDKKIDWWAEARKLTQQSDDEMFDRWLLEQGHERYASIMQGPLPITNSVKSTLPTTQEDVTGYLNTYGDMEIKVSENCVAQTQVSARLDISDFTEKLPMRIVCKSTKKEHYSFDRK